MDSLKVLGQSSPGATTETKLYTVPVGRATNTTSLVVCNRDSVEITFRASVSTAGSATLDKDYIYYNVPVGVGDTFVATIGLTLAEGDIVRVYASTSKVSFSLYGLERG